jgi:hypothetical protein
VVDRLTEDYPAIRIHSGSWDAIWIMYKAARGTEKTRITTTFKVQADKSIDVDIALVVVAVIGYPFIDEISRAFARDLYQWIKRKAQRVKEEGRTIEVEVNQKWKQLELDDEDLGQR